MNKSDPYDKFLVIDMTEGRKYYYRTMKEASRKIMQLETLGNMVQLYQLVYSGGMILLD